MTRETLRQFIARVGYANEVVNALHYLQPHICRDHPFVADTTALPYTVPDIDEAIETVNQTPHDPFEGIAPPVAVPTEQMSLAYTCDATNDAGGHGLRCTLDDRHAGKHRDDRYGMEW